MAVVRLDTLVGKKVVLRQYDKNTDLDLCYDWFSDPEIRCWLESTCPATRKEVEAALDRKAADENTRLFVIVARDSGDTVGVISLENISWHDQTSLSEIFLGKRYWSRGYALEAALMMIIYAFDALHLRKLSTFVLEHNVRSRKLIKKCGFRQEGRCRRQAFRRGWYYDTILLGLFKEDFMRVWKKYLASRK